MASELLHGLSQHDWKRIGAHFPDAKAKEGEVTGFLDFTARVREYIESSVESAYGERSLTINPELAGIFAANAILAYRRYGEELEALDIMQQHFALEYAGSAEE